jgi:magnesium transporter
MQRATELYLSSILNKKIINPDGQIIGKLWDVAIDPGENLPSVQGLLIKQGRNIYNIPWQHVVLLNPMILSVLGTSEEYPVFEPTQSVILLRRDVLDKQIVDVNGAKVVRVNDIKLTPYEDLLCISSVDIGFRGLLRRIGYERAWSLIQKNIPHSEIGWQFVNHLEMNAARLTLSMAREQLADMHPADLAEIIANLPRDSVKGVLNSLDHETAGETIHELELELRTKIIRLMDSEQVSDILEEMAPDEAADILGDLPEEMAQELLGLMDKEEAEEIQELMEYEENTAGALMNHEFIAISHHTTVGEALNEIKRQAQEVETIYYAYVLDDTERLAGVISVRDLFISQPACPVSDVMTEHLKMVHVETKPVDILSIFAKYDLIAVPVLDKQGKMVGVVTIDDVVEIFLPASLKRRRHHN